MNKYSSSILLILIFLLSIPSLAQDTGNIAWIDSPQRNLNDLPAQQLQQLQAPPVMTASMPTNIGELPNDAQTNASFPIAGFSPQDGGINDYFGVDLDVSGTTMIVGATGESAAYTYTWDGTGWQPQQKLTPAGAGCGIDVDIDGGLIAIGCTDTRSVFTYAWNGASWVATDVLSVPTDGDGIFYGWSISLAGNTLAVATGTSSVGFGSLPQDAYVYLYNGGSWSLYQTLDPQFPAPGGSPAIDETGAPNQRPEDVETDDGVTVEFRNSYIEMHGNTIFYGVIYPAILESKPGDVFVYTFNSGLGTWEQTQILEANTSGGTDSFGAAMAIHDDAAFISAPNDYSGSGAVRSYIRNTSGTWVQTEEIFGSWDQMYYDGKVLTLGDVDYSTGNGSVEIYVSNGKQNAYIDRIDSFAGENFGVSVATFGTQLIVGASLNDSTFTNVGQVAVYQTEARLGTITGRVTDTNGNPVPNVQVGYASSFGYQPTCSDADGYYQLINVPINEPLRVHTETESSPFWCGVQGPQNSVVYFWGDTIFYWSASILTLPNNAPDATGIDLKWEQGGSISGAIRDALTTQPIPNVRFGIYITDEFGNAIGFQYCDDSFGGTNDGLYTYKGVPFDTPVRVIVDVQGCGDNAAYEDGSVPTLQTVTAGNPVLTGVDVSLALPGTITGTITQSDTGNPQPFMSVFAYSASGQFWSASGCTDANGNYTINSVPAGRPIYVVTADATQFNGCSGFAPYGRTYSGDTMFFSQYQTYTLSSSQTQTVNIAQRRMGAVNARVTDANTGLGISAMALNVTSYDPNTTFTANGSYCSTSSGNYTGYAPYGENFRVSVSVANQNCSAQQIPYVTQWFGGDYRANTGTLLMVDSGTPSQSIRIQTTVGGSLSGQIFDGFSNPLTSGFAQVTDLDGNVISAIFINNSNYQVLGIPLNVPVLVRADMFNNRALEWWQESPSATTATQLTFTQPNQVVSGVNFTVDFATTISGNVTVDGVPLTGIPVRVEGFPFTVCTDASGNYTIARVDFNEEYVVSAGGQADFCAASGVGTTQFYDGATDAGSATTVFGGTTGVNFNLTSASPIMDINGDNVGSPIDVLFIINRIGQTVPPGDAAADVNGDGVIDTLDVLEALGN